MDTGIRTRPVDGWTTLTGWAGERGGMDRPRDPIEEAADGEEDLYEVATWEPRTLLDHVSAMVSRLVPLAARITVVLVAALLLVTLFFLGDLSEAATDPLVLAMVPLSAMPALALAALVWESDAVSRQPLSLLVITFALGVLTAMFAAVVNSLLSPLFAVVPVIGMSLYFYLVVGPVEEAVKLLAVRLHAFDSPRFDSVIDGAVYGAMAGLGFATVENYLYISRGMDAAGADGALIGAVGGVAAVRALVGPGHVVFSAIAGYYLGLAKFNPEHAGPLVVKGLIIASVFHATYNTLVGFVPDMLNQFVGPFDGMAGFLGFLVAYQGLLLLYLFAKLRTYTRTYERVQDGTASGTTPTSDAETASNAESGSDLESTSNAEPVSNAGPPPTPESASNPELASTPDRNEKPDSESEREFSWNPEQDSQWFEE